MRLTSVNAEVKTFDIWSQLGQHFAGLIFSQKFTLKLYRQKVGIKFYPVLYTKISTAVKLIQGNH